MMAWHGGPFGTEAVRRQISPQAATLHSAGVLSNGQIIARFEPLLAQLMPLPRWAMPGMLVGSILKEGGGGGAAVVACRTRSKYAGVCRIATGACIDKLRERD